MRVCACVRACVCDRPHVRALVGACVFALTGHMRAHVKLCMCLCMHVHVRAGVGAHACAFAGVGQRTCGLCVRAYEFICMHDYIRILLYMQAQCVCTIVRTRMYLRAYECRPMCVCFASVGLSM